MSSVATITLFGYMMSLAIALTWYGARLMILRWYFLSALLIVSGLYWISSRQRGPYRWKKMDNALVIIYLIATFLSVLGAENPLFSGLRWLSHALMITALLVLLKNSLTPAQVTSVLPFLKAVVAALLLVSWLKPLPPSILTNSELYRGAFGCSNALGQVAAVGAILYLHGFLTDKVRWLRMAQIAMLCLAAWILWSSGSRSAMVAFLAGLALLHYFYPKIMRGRILVSVVVVSLMVLLFPGLPGKVEQVVLRSDRTTATRSFSEQLLITRSSVWQASWEGFLKRPLLGWGFGADDKISKTWEVRLTALGTVTRDYVNDSLVILESTGVVGFFAYVLLIIFALRQIPTRRERRLLERIHSPPSSSKGFDFAPYHLHAITFILGTTLLIMVQFDNTALSAGNFVSVTLWVCVALAGAMRRKVMADELLHQRQRQSFLQHATAHMRAAQASSGITHV